MKLPPISYGALFAAMGLTHHPVSGKRLDANETAFLTRQVEFVRAKTFEVKTLSLLSRGFVQLATDIPPWANHVVEVTLDGSGRARVISNGGEDFPRTDVVASESTYKVVSIGASYAWTLMDLRQALATGVPLSERKAARARRAIDAAIDEVIATGALASVGQSFGASGLINASSVPVTVMSAGSWAAATADAIIADMVKLIQAPGIATGEVFPANRVLLAPEKYDFLATKARSATSDTTILEFLQRTNKQVTFEKFNRLSAAGAGGVNDRTIAYNDSAEVVEAVVPQEFEQLPPQVVNLETLTLCHARAGGVIWHHNKGATYGDHVD